MSITNYEEVDAALKRLCEVEVALSMLDGEVTLKCNNIKESYKEKTEPLANEAAFIKQEIENFCEMNKADFAEKRSKEFVFGTIGYRLSKSVSLPRLKPKIDALIKAIKSFGFEGCIKYEEKPCGEALAELADGDLVKLGLKRVVKDNFRIEPKLESLKNEDVPAAAV